MNEYTITMQDTLDSILDFNFRLTYMYCDPRIPNDESLFFVSIAQSNLKEMIETRLSSSDNIESLIGRIQRLCDQISLYSKPLMKFLLRGDIMKYQSKPTIFKSLDEIDFGCHYLVIITEDESLRYIPYKSKFTRSGDKFISQRDQYAAWISSTGMEFHDLYFIEDKSLHDPDSVDRRVAAIMCSTDDEDILREIKDNFKLSIDTPTILVSDLYLWLGDLYKKVIKLYEDSDKLDVYKPINPIASDTVSLKEIHNRDILVYTPYMTYNIILQYMTIISQSDNVEYIFQSIYRLNDENSIIVNILAAAAKMGKKVYVIMEERARGNEESNYEYAKTLIEAGCHVILNNSSKKIHSKFFVAVGSDRQYAIVSTGNFNEKTAHIYTDLHYLTSNEVIVRSLVHLINSIINMDYKNTYQEELVFNDYLFTSPHNIKSQLLMKIHEQGMRGKAGRIFIKCNNMDNKEIIEALINAANNGCEVRLLIRSICTLVNDGCDNMIIKTKIGQFLEHDRVYIFGDNEEVYIGSADLMDRNLDNRVETLLHVKDNHIANQIIKIFQMNWYDIDHLIDPKLDQQFKYLYLEGDTVGSNSETDQSGD